MKSATIVVSLLGFSVLLTSCSTRSNGQYGLRDSIQGAWWADTSAPSAAFSITGDTLMLVDQLETSPFWLNGNKLTYLYAGDSLTYEIAMRGPDTLVFLSGPYVDTPNVMFRWSNEEVDINYE